MAEISLQFCREARLTSDIIAWFTGGKFSHVDAYVPDGLLGAYERESCKRDACSIGPGVFIRPPGYATFVVKVRFDIAATDRQRDRWLAFLYRQIGKPYDWDAIAAFPLGRTWRAPNSWICSELQAAALEFAGIVPQLYLAASKITPVSLALALSALPTVSIVTLK